MRPCFAVTSNKSQGQSLATGLATNSILCLLFWLRITISIQYGDSFDTFLEPFNETRILSDEVLLGWTVLKMQTGRNCVSDQTCLATVGVYLEQNYFSHGCVF